MAMQTGQGAAAVRRVCWRILPLLFAAYFVAYINRVNVGFAALTMNHDLGLSAQQFGLAAGLYPGLLYILVMWAPEKYRVRMLMLMILSTPFSVMVGSLISQPILMLDGVSGLRGWQWLFILQALPTIALGLAFRFALPAGPQSARWLPPAEKQWLGNQLAAERQQRERVRRFRVVDVLFSPVVWVIAIAGTGINAAAYGLILF